MSEVKEETGPELLERLGTDAMLWAQEFNKTAVRLGYSDMDEGWLIGWFANAIENTCMVRKCHAFRDYLQTEPVDPDTVIFASRHNDATGECEPVHIEPEMVKRIRDMAAEKRAPATDKRGA